MFVSFLYTGCDFQTCFKRIKAPLDAAVNRPTANQKPWFGTRQIKPACVAPRNPPNMRNIGLIFGEKWDQQGGSIGASNPAAWTSLVLELSPLIRQGKDPVTYCCQDSPSMMEPPGNSSNPSWWQSKKLLASQCFHPAALTERCRSNRPKARDQKANIQSPEIDWNSTKLHPCRVEVHKLKPTCTLAAIFISPTPIFMTNLWKSGCKFMLSSDGRRFQSSGPRHGCADVRGCPGESWADVQLGTMDAKEGAPKVQEHNPNPRKYMFLSLSGQYDSLWISFVMMGRRSLTWHTPFMFTCVNPLVKWTGNLLLYRSFDEGNGACSTLLYLITCVKYWLYPHAQTPIYLPSTVQFRNVCLYTTDGETELRKNNSCI